MSYLLGKKAISDAIENGIKITNIKATKKHYDFLKKIKNVNYEIVSKNFFNKYKSNHQEIIAFIEDQVNNNYSLEQIIEISKKHDNFTIVILDKIESPHNFGAIIRSSVAFGVDAIIYKNNNQSPINDIVIKTSIGTINYIKLCNVSNINYVIDKLKTNDFWIYGSTLSEDSKYLEEFVFSNKSVIIFGNEDKGISKLTLDKCDHLFKIKMNNNVQSLNVSVAAGIILYTRFKNL